MDDFINSLQSIDKSGITIDNVEELTKRCCILAAEAYCFKGKFMYPAFNIKTFTRKVKLKHFITQLGKSQAFL